MAARLAGTAAVAAICGAIVVGGLSIFSFLYFTSANQNKTLASSGTPGGSTQAAVVFLYRVGILHIIIGTIGLVASFAYVSSALTLACGVVAVVTMRDLASAIEISHGRAASCSRPVHGANLAIAALVFCVTDLAVFAGIYATAVPGFFDYVALCKAAPLSCSTYYADAYMKTM